MGNLAKELLVQLFSQNCKDLTGFAEHLIKNRFVGNLTTELPALMVSQNFRDLPWIVDLLIKSRCV